MPEENNLHLPNEKISGIAAAAKGEMVKHNYIYKRQTIRRGKFRRLFYRTFCSSKHLRRRKHKTPNTKAEKSTRRGERDKRGKREQKLSRVNVLNGGAGGKHGLPKREVQNGAAGEQHEKTAGGVAKRIKRCGGLKNTDCQAARGE